jgi:hypothetical protein
MSSAPTCSCRFAHHERFLDLGFIVGDYAAAGTSAFDEPFHSAGGELFG